MNVREPPAHARIIVFLSASRQIRDIYLNFGLEELSPEIDYLSPMLYPSSFQYGIPGYRNPVANADAIGSLSLKQAQERMDGCYGILTTRIRKAELKPK
jgi:hypothetical protein